MRPDPRRQLALRSVVGLAVLVGLLLGLSGVPARAGAASSYTVRRLSSPARTQVLQGTKVVATFTDGSRSVALGATSRTFDEQTDPANTVTTPTWVRLLGSPFTGTVDLNWVTARLADTSPDVLAMAMQYRVGEPAIVAGGLQIAGDAAYGPLQPDGTRAEGSDFNDYLGISYTYPGGVVDAPEADQFRSLDCSGFMRMVLGYRGGVPMTLAAGAADRLPRRAVDQASSGTGVVLIANTGVAPASRSVLQAGDLVFFDVSTDDGTLIDHVGMFLGRDNAGNDRFISSRKSANGPTMGDLSGRSVLNGTGLYATGFRSARRV